TEKDILAAHNAARSTHHANPLSWDPVLAGTALKWANGCVFEHSGGKLLEGGYGENLAAWAPYSDSGSACVSGWVDEEKDYDYSNPGFSESTGHFTQVVWKSTSTVGCALINCGN
ncbi:PR-1-like protein, partial [Meredithblackwellia eburnea MCA 4105]